MMISFDLSVEDENSLMRGELEEILTCPILRASCCWNV